MVTPTPVSGRHSFAGPPTLCLSIAHATSVTQQRPGAEVAMVELASVPLERVLGPLAGAIYRDLHIEHGVQLHLGVGVDSLRGTGSVEEVCLSDGSLLPADVVVVDIGMIPRVELAQAAGLELDNGIVVDEHLAASAPGVFAAGDVANAFHPRYGTRVRLEHWSAALNQGPVAAKNMLGDPTAYDRLPYFFSDQYDLGMEYRGWAPIRDQVVFRGDPATREFIAFWIRDGRVRAAMNANIWDAGEPIEALLLSGLPIDLVRLADPDESLAALAVPAKG